MTPLSSIKFKEIEDYLQSKKFVGLFASKRKHTIVYTFERYYNSTRKMSVKIKVMRKTKYVASVKIKDNIFVDFDELKAEIEK